MADKKIGFIVKKDDEYLVQPKYSHHTELKLEDLPDYLKVEGLPVNYNEVERTIETEGGEEGGLDELQMYAVDLEIDIRRAKQAQGYFESDDGKPRVHTDDDGSLAVVSSEELGFRDEQCVRFLLLPLKEEKENGYVAINLLADSRRQSMKNFFVSISYFTWLFPIGLFGYDLLFDAFTWTGTALPVVVGLLLALFLADEDFHKFRPAGFHVPALLLLVALMHSFFYLMVHVWDGEIALVDDQPRMERFSYRPLGSSLKFYEVETEVPEQVYASRSSDDAQVSLQMGLTVGYVRNDQGGHLMLTSHKGDNKVAFGHAMIQDAWNRLAKKKSANDLQNMPAKDMVAALLRIMREEITLPPGIYFRWDGDAPVVASFAPSKS